MGLSWILAFTMVLMQAPVLQGKATFYSAPYLGRPMRNGQPYTGQDATCAVNGDLWPGLAGARLLICTGYTERCIIVTVTDTGDPQTFARYDVATDLSPAAFRVLIGPLAIGIADITAWKLP